MRRPGSNWLVDSRIAARVFMRFLYLRGSPHLENLRRGWHLIAIAGEVTWPASPISARQEFSMLDILMLALGAGFFLLSVGYAYACERL